MEKVLLIVLGAVLAILGGFLQIWYQDRKRIKLDANIGRLWPNETEKPLLYASMTNVGKRPIYIVGWGVLRKKKKGEKGRPGFVIPGKNLPILLKDGESNTEITDELEIFSTVEVTSIYIWDSTGKKWKISKKNLKRVLKNAEEVRVEKGQNI